MKYLSALAIVASVVIASSGSSAYASIERVDFQPLPGRDPYTGVTFTPTTQAGFEAVTSNLATLASGVTIATTGYKFDRNPGFTNGGAFTYEDLLDDFAYAGLFAQVGNAPITLTIGNLAPLADYFLRIYSADGFTGSPTFADVINTTYTPTSGTGGAAFTSSFDRTQNPLTNQQYSGAGLLTSNAAGEITLLITAAPGGGSTANAFTRLNGLELESVDALPEPASVAVWSLLGVAAGCIHWKKQAA
jgi:hypothetical protein